MTDWEKIRTGFVKDGLSYRAISREFAAPYSTIQRRGIKEDWPGQREEYLEENVGEKMKQVKTKLLRRIERTLDEDRELDSKDFKAMTGALKRLFIDRRFKEGEEPEEHSFIQSLITDNTALMEADPQYIKQLEALPPKLRDAWLYGNWEIFEGQFFEDFRTEPDMRAAAEHGESLTADELRAQRRWVHVIEPFDLNAGSCRGWRIMRSYDFGYGKPFSCAWWAIDYDGVIYRILELYSCTGTPNEGVRWTPDQQFAEIARIEREHPWLRGKKIEGVADPAIWDASRGESIADTAARYGLYFTKGDNERIPGWMQCHYRLQFDEEGYSRMYVFSNCAAFIRTVPGMMFSRTAPEDLDTEMEDHVCDEWRYMCMSRPVAPLKPVERRVMMNDPLGR